MEEPLGVFEKRARGPITRNEAAIGTGSEMSLLEKIFFDLPAKDFLSPREVAGFLSMPLRTVCRLYQMGVIQGIGLNQSFRIRKDSLLQYVMGGIGK